MHQTSCGERFAGWTEDDACHQGFRLQKGDGRLAHPMQGWDRQQTEHSKWISAFPARLR